MKINNFPPTLEQIKNINFSDHDNPDLETGDYTIIRYDDEPELFDVYHKNQAGESDPDPIFTGSAEMTHEFLKKI